MLSWRTDSAKGTTQLLPPYQQYFQSTKPCTRQPSFAACGAPAKAACQRCVTSVQLFDVHFLTGFERRHPLRQPQRCVWHVWPCLALGLGVLHLCQPLRPPVQCSALGRFDYQQWHNAQACDVGTHHRCADYSRASNWKIQAAATSPKLFLQAAHLPSSGSF